MNQMIDIGHAADFWQAGVEFLDETLAREPREESLEGDAREQALHNAVLNHLVDTPQLGRTARGELQSDQGEAAQDEQKRQGDDEGRKPRQDDELSVDRAENARER